MELIDSVTKYRKGVEKILENKDTISIENLNKILWEEVNKTHRNTDECDKWH